ncbi:hypothetical protein [Nocardioides panzhihuensis]|uniref:ABC-type glycerol-3-phosphate transport system permease component n=1 Tax=Nocardioides panzhihuensis TaxID=860243 RepID=A0A7Z0ITG8_9ACTN|nr:hypothetical protein [Nocardioides panzhihuensis]NYI78905.1 ABC-type glycerol-3-phosphate transport system permease component [Nocardioides panzhihuensis]
MSSQMTATDDLIESTTPVVGPPRNRGRDRRERRTTVLVTGALVIVTLAMVFPLIWTFMSATKPLIDAFASRPRCFTPRRSTRSAACGWRPTSTGSS